MSRGAGAAVRGEAARHARNQQEVRHRAVHRGPEIGPVDRKIRRPAIVAHAVEADVERVEHGRAERVGVADGADCASSKLPGDVVVSRLLPLNTGGFVQCIAEISSIDACASSFSTQSMRPMNCCSSPVCGMPYVTLPHWLADATGRYFEASATAGPLSCDTGIWLPGNGAPPTGFISWTGLPFDWHAAEAMVLKSPFSMAAWEYG